MKSGYPHLNFNKNTEETLNFCTSVFWIDFFALRRFKIISESEDTSENAQEIIIHNGQKICDNIILIDADAMESMGHNLIVRNNMHIPFQTASKGEADRLFHSLSEGGKIENQLQNSFGVIILLISRVNFEFAGL